MKIISDRGISMPSSPIRRLVPFADKARNEGKHIYHLNIGQPDIKTPESFIRGVKEMDMSIIAYGPSSGYLSLRKKFAEYYSRFNIDVAPEEILITTGGSEAILFTLMAIADPGDEIITPEPFYTNYNGFAVESGVRIVPIKSTIEEDFQLPPIQTITEKINSRTRAILICNPNNPTGYVYSKEEFETLRSIVLQYNLFLITDEVYREFVYGGEKHVSALHLKDIGDRVIMLDSVSKRYSACGARIGMIVSKNKEVIETVLKFGMARLCPPSIEQEGCIAAVDTPDEYFKEVIQEYISRRDIMVSLLRDIPGVICPMPKGAFYLIAQLPVENADDFAQWLLTDFSVNDETVLIAPANGFYSTKGLGENQVRIAYVLKVEDIRKAINIIAEGLKVYTKRKI